MNKNILVFGAGPSGLSTAYGGKNNLNISVKIYEKRSSEALQEV